MGALPSDLVDPSEAFAPSAAPPKLPSDLVDPSQASFGGSSPPSSDSDSSAGAFGYGVVKGVPGGARIASAGVPIAQRVGDALNWLKGGPNEDQRKAIAGLPQDYSSASNALSSQGGQAAKENPWTYAVGTALPQLLLPGGGTVKGAAGYGAALGAGEGDNLSDSVVKGTIGAAGGAGGAKIANSLMPMAGAARQGILSAADRLGVAMPRYAVGSPLTQMAGKIGFSIPGANAPLEEATHELIAGLGTAAEKAAGSATRESAGSAASSGLKNWIGPVSQGDVDAKYNAVQSALTNPNATTPLSATQSVANQIIKNRGALQDPSGALQQVQKALGVGKGTYGDIKALRTSIGQMMDSPSTLPAGVQGAELKQLYGGLSADLESAAYASGGQPAVAAHQAATAFAKDTAARRAQLTELLGGPKGDASNEAVFGAIKRAAGSTDAADIALLRQASDPSVIPPASWDQVSRGMVSTLGRDGDGNFSPNLFLRDYGKFSDAAKDELFAANTPLRQNLDDLATVSRQWKGLGKYTNTSHTAGHIVGAEMLQEAPEHPLKILAQYLGGATMGKFLSSPAGAGASSTWVKAMGSGNENMVRNAAKKIAAVAGAQAGAKVDPMGLAALALRPYLEEHGGVGSGDTGQPQ